MSLAVRLFVGLAFCNALMISHAVQAQNYSDIWWNPNESGWGLTLADHNTQLVGVWYTYGPDGSPTWYVIPGGTFAQDKRFFSGDLYQTTGPAYNATFNPSLVLDTKVGTASFDFAPPGLAPGTALFSYTIGSVSQTKQIQRQPFGSAAPNWGADYTDLWWNASESGWGLTLAQHGDNIFGVWFTYDAAGKPLWIVLPGVNFTNNNSFSGTLYTTTGPPLANVPFDPSHVVVTPVGSASIVFNGHSGTFTSTVHGYTQSKAITSEPFGDSPPPQGVSVNALIPPGALSGLDASAIQQYVLNNPTVNGGTFQVEWSAIDQGPAAGSNQYNWTYTDSLYAAWSNAGKQVNFVFWPNADSSSNNCGAEGQYGDGTVGNCAIPAYVWNALSLSNYTTCAPANTAGPQRIPNYFAAAFQTNYQNFIKAAVQRYGGSNFPNIGYIRFGLGHGGETIPVGDWNSGDACSVQLKGWGLTISSWTAYLTGMLNYEGSLNSHVQLMAGITPMSGNAVPDAVAHAAVPLNIGFGSQGLESSDVNNCAGSTADWCNLFNNYAGKVPLELQTLAQSCPGGSCATGSLATLLPFAIANHATILEIYYQDWLVAFDSNYRGYFPSYQAVLQSAATGH